MILEATKKLIELGIKNSSEMVADWNIQNLSNSVATFSWSHSYQMMLWDYLWRNIAAKGNNNQIDQINVTTKTFGNQMKWGDTNAEVSYWLYCARDNKWVEFQFRVRNYEWLHVHWVGDGAWNNCFDLTIEATIRERVERKINGGWGGVTYDYVPTQYIGTSLVSGTLAVPNKWTMMNVKIIPHESFTRFIMIYEHCDYLGKSTALGRTSGNNPWMGEWNDIVSSVRIPPGMKLILYEHSNYSGASVTLRGDISCLASRGFNDRASSYVIEINENLLN